MSEYFYATVTTRWSQTNVGTNAGVSATQAAPTGTNKHVCAGIEASGDTAALVTVESPSGTVLYKKRFAAAFTMSETFAPGTITGAAGAAMLVKVSASTSNSEANIQGFTLSR